MHNYNLIADIKFLLKITNGNINAKMRPYILFQLENYVIFIQSLE